jgi:hypothetical protein
LDPRQLKADFSSIHTSIMSVARDSIMQLFEKLNGFTRVGS